MSKFNVGEMVIIKSTRSIGTVVEIIPSTLTYDPTYRITGTGKHPSTMLLHQSKLEGMETMNPRKSDVVAQPVSKDEYMNKVVPSENLFDLKSELQLAKDKLVESVDYRRSDLPDYDAVECVEPEPPKFAIGDEVSIIKTIYIGKYHSNVPRRATVLTSPMSFHDGIKYGLVYSDESERVEAEQFLYPEDKMTLLKDTNIKQPTPRIHWGEYFMAQALLISTRSTCNKLAVGAVIVKDNRLIASGYNGSPSGQPHCTDHGCLMDDQDHCVRTVHAEQNAILQCAKMGVSTDGATLYTTHYPCINCTKALIQAGIKEVYYLNDHHNGEYEGSIMKVAGVKVYKGRLSTKIGITFTKLINSQKEVEHCD